MDLHLPYDEIQPQWIEEKPIQEQAIFKPVKNLQDKINLIKFHKAHR